MWLLTEERERRRQRDQALADRCKSLLRASLDLQGIRPAFLPAEAVRDVRELKGLRHLFRHAYDLDLDPARVEAAAQKRHPLRGPLRWLVRSLLGEGARIVSRRTRAVKTDDVHHKAVF